MSEKSIKAKRFFRKNLYYFIFLITLTAVTIAAVILIVANSKPTVQQGEQQNEQENNNPSENPQGGDTQGEDTQGGGSQSGNGQNEEPVSTVIVFDLPINGTVIKDYTDTVCYNSTLNVYTGHMAIDFGAEDGTSVCACYGGTISEIKSEYLKGTTIVIDHGNGLKSYYNGLDANESLAVGQTVNKGDVLGELNSSNQKEFKDGPHLHFEVTENAKKVNPNKYLLIEEK